VQGAGDAQGRDVALEGAQRRGLWGVPGTVIYPVVFFFLFAGGGAFQQFYIRGVTSCGRITPERAGLLLSSVYFAYAFSRFLVGRLAYSMGEYAVFILAAVTYVTFPASIFFANSFWALLGFSVLLGVGAPFIHTVAPSLMLDAGDRGNRRGRSVGALYFWLSAGFMLGAFGYAAIEGAEALGDAQRRYRIIGVLGAAVAAIGVLAAAAGPRNIPKRDFPTVAGFIDIMRIKGAWLLAAILFGSSISFGLMLSVFFDEVSSSLGFTIGGLAAFYGTRTVMTYLSGALSDRLHIRRARVLAASYFLAGSGLLLAALADRPWAWLAAAVALGAQAGTSVVVPQAIVGDWAPREKRHIAFTSIFFWGTIGIALTIASGTWLREAFGDSGWNWVVFGVLLIALGLLSLRLERGGTTARRSMR